MVMAALSFNAKNGTFFEKAILCIFYSMDGYSRLISWRLHERGEWSKMRLTTKLKLWNEMINRNISTVFFCDTRWELDLQTFEKVVLFHILIDFLNSIQNFLRTFTAPVGTIFNIIG